MNFPSLHDLLDTELSDEDSTDVIENLAEQICNSSFQRWHQTKEFGENIQKGQSYFNGPSPPSEATRHTPSQLLQCHRKLYYREYNAPKETLDPRGIFWAGEKVETELIVPYFQAIVADEIYVQNSVWVDFTIKSDTGQLQFKGKTDPVFVDPDGVPILLTEIKTKDSVENLGSPNDHHLAQAHAYMYGLTQKFDRRITDVLLVYVGRTTLNLKMFHTEFDPLFWRRQVLDWAGSHSRYQIRDQLPPADPEFEWECEFCSYRERCGKGTKKIGGNSLPHGFLPVHEYTEKAVTTHLEAHKDKDVQLTPTVANQFPKLASEVGVYDWHCQSCSETFKWETLEPPQPGELVPCPACQEESADEGSVRGPTPEEQVLIDNE